MGHCGGWRGAVPVPTLAWTPDHITRANFFDRAAFALGPADARGDDQCLAERMSVPIRACALLERDDCAAGAANIPALLAGRELR